MKMKIKFIQKLRKYLNNSIQLYQKYDNQLQNAQELIMGSLRIISNDSYMSMKIL